MLALSGSLQRRLRRQNAPSVRLATLIPSTNSTRASRVPKARPRAPRAVSSANHVLLASTVTASAARVANHVLQAQLQRRPSQLRASHVNPGLFTLPVVQNVKYVHWVGTRRCKDRPSASCARQGGLRMQRTPRNALYVRPVISEKRARTARVVRSAAKGSSPPSAALPSARSAQLAGRLTAKRRSSASCVQKVNRRTRR